MAVVAAITAVVANSRANRMLPISPDESVEILERAVAQLVELETVPLDRERLARELSRAIDRDIGQGIGSPERSSLGASAAEFLSTRFLSDSPSDMTRWRQKRGDVRRDLQWLKDKWFIDEASKAYFGELCPEMEWDALYEHVLAGQDAFKDGATRIVEVAEGIGMAATVKRLSRIDPSWPRLPGPISDVMDHGAGMSISSPWWIPAVVPSDEVKAGREPLVASVAFVAKFGDGSVRPVSISMVHNPRTGVWHVVSLCHGVFSKDDTSSVRWEY